MHKVALLIKMALKRRNEVSMSTILSILVAILIFSVIVIVHELGHFLLAKRNGIGVTEFSLGMGPRLYSFTRGETKYSLKLFPIGGSCMMIGEDEDSKDESAFNNKGVWQRISVIFAGPFFNFIFAFVLAVIIISLMGVDLPTVGPLQEDQPAAQAGLREGDIITSINGSSISIAREIRIYFDFNEMTGEPLTIEYLRGEEEGTAVITPKAENRYMLGFSYDTAGTNKISSVTEDSAFEEAGIEAGDLIVAIDGTPVKNSAEITQYLEKHPASDQPMELTFDRDGEVIQKTILPRVTKSYSTGLTYGYREREKQNPIGVLKYSVIEVKYWIVTTVKSLGKLITGAFRVQDLGGPVRIVSEITNTVESAREDGALYIFVNLLNWGILISANLGVMNLLPIPALDGGRLVFLGLEAIRRKPLNREKEGFVHMIGLILLMALMVFVFFNDIKNVFL